VTGSNEDDEEVTALFRKLGGRLRGYLINMGADSDLADEIVNDAFAAVRRHWQRLRAGRPDIYLHKVARNEIDKRKRKQAKWPVSHYEDLPEIEITEIEFDRFVDRDTLRWALDQLTEREREVLLLRYFSGHTIAETAKIMGIEAGTVKRYSSDGLRKLRKLLEDGNGTGEAGGQ
jgi:RNA polymerase sigma factor (sigma-70 family)